MKAVIQRVKEARVLVGEELVGAISQGILLLLGVEKGDSEKEADYILNKIIELRIFEDDRGKMNLSLKEISGGLLVVSQFTLLGDCRKGRRPSFSQAEDPARAEEIYNYFLAQSRNLVLNTAAGRFGAMMQVHLVNDGPVTFILECVGGVSDLN